MELKLKTIAKKEGYTIGRLYVDGVYLCDTLEDKVRDIKVYGKTAIPEGRYIVDTDIVSPKFQYRSWARICKGRIPRLRNVPNFTGVLIHVGNSAKDTDGCILVGYNTIKGRLTSSTIAFNRLITLLSGAKNSITLTVIR